MHFPGRKPYVFVVEKVHFQKSDIFAMSKRKMCRGTTSGCAEKPHRPRDPSVNLANTIGKRYVFENGAVARMFLRFRALKTVEIRCFFELADLKFDSEINKSTES